ncbi:hypothetical protein [Amycolatopsis nigrescens]|uniref:hypothetical protein n=1 Tax=Amycolatopsis nigrescens TaxID=381445 RepID=UPI0003775BC3|nr:hypothetical protein [Amycolatopsis nigrescens]
MSGYEAQIQALRTAAEAARSAGRQVSGVDLAGAITGAASAMPGSQTAKTCGTLGNSWRGDLSGWVAQADGYANDLSIAADGYAANEEAAAAAFPTVAK